MGIYAAADSSSVCSAPVITPSSGESITAGTTTVSITADSGESIKYTLDGSDPKTSETAAEYSSEISSSGWSGEKTVRAYAYKAGSYDSAVVSATYEI